MTTRRTFIASAAGLASSWALAPSARAQAPKTLRFGVGPLLPTAEDTKKSFDPFFAWLAKQLRVDYELSATTDWAGMAVAMGSPRLQAKLSIRVTLHSMRDFPDSATEQALGLHAVIIAGHSAVHRATTLVDIAHRDTTNGMVRPASPSRLRWQRSP
ncbi:hypothetical protein [Paraburkholderia sp. UYCP14C]|uniref:hypothetical protein n=1 Tax=Paraburkholderia sp. UYCP14C TaxID=2511130 RepID=UPI001B7D5A32|nr:hypothetical protein [Paraburkholderia sp. UYCP14C]